MGTVGLILTQLHFLSAIDLTEKIAHGSGGVWGVGGGVGVLSCKERICSSLLIEGLHWKEEFAPLGANSSFKS